MAAKTPEPALNPADYIEAWGQDNIRRDAFPSPGTLKEVGRALHAVQEFLVDEIAAALKRIAADVSEANRGADTIGTYPRPEADRAVTYENIGQLIAWTDELRLDLSYLLDPLTEIVLLVHEDLQDIASGYTPGGVLEDAPWNARMRRFHGLDRGLSRV